jgi:hypothetical protein
MPRLSNTLAINDNQNLASVVAFSRAITYARSNSTFSPSFLSALLSFAPLRSASSCHALAREAAFSLSFAVCCRILPESAPHRSACSY